MSEAPYDALLVLSFGGPNGPDDVMPFLERVVQGRNVPRDRLLEVAEHYYEFGGVSPINAQNRALIAALIERLAVEGPNLPVYWGNRNWHPLIEDTVTEMADAGVRRALCFVTSAFSSYSSCRQYREDIARARSAVGDRAPEIEKLRIFYNHPFFIESVADRTRAALDEISEDRRAAAQLVFTAHSIPVAMAKGCDYEAQLREASQLVADSLGHEPWQLVYQSRSGPPAVPWLEPDVCDHLRAIREQGIKDAVVIPLGFVSDHMEVLFDLDTEARDVANEIG
ncbi:MAG: ferrochelatase, partial [Pirellulales bacterium]|nr:ferrochelatase [Pirellulales bacterium]